MTWSLDPHHTSVSFSAKHLGVATVRGRFGQVTADLELDDPNDPTTGSGAVTVQSASITTGSEMRDGHLKSADFLDVEKYPEIVFKLRSVAPSGDQYNVTGDLTIKGVSRPVVLDVDYLGLVSDPWGGDRIVFSASGVIDREDFGITWNMALDAGGLLVSKRIELELELEAIYQPDPTTAA